MTIDLARAKHAARAASFPGARQIKGLSILCALLMTPSYGLAAEKIPGKPAAKKSTRQPNSRPTGSDRPTPNNKGPKGVVAQFALAMRLFDAGKFNEALAAFDRIHKTYPAHEPTIIQYAKTLYRLDRIPESYNLFSRVNPQYLDPETAYEYGYAFYIQNRFDGALFSFKRVPVDHPLYDLASYYGAMSAIRLKKYAEAEELLDKAVVLPDKLARSKPLYQKHVSSLRQLQEKSDLERATWEEKQRLSSDQTRGKTPQSTAPQAPAAPEKYMHAGFYGVDRFGKIKMNQTSQTSDLHGYSTRTYNSQSGTFLFSQGPMVALPLKLDNNRQAAIGAQIDLSATNVTTEGTQDRLVASEDSQDIVRNLSERLPTQTTRTGGIGGSLWVETPIPSGWWLGLNGHLSFTYPNFERGQRYGVRGASAHLGWMRLAPTSWTADLTGTYDLIVDSETEPVTAQSIAEGSLGVKTSYAFSTKLSAKYISYDYKLPLLPGPDTSTSATLTLKQDFPLGAALSLGGTAERQENYIARNLPSVGSASANGVVVSGFAKFSVTPFDWITAAATHSRSQSTWTVLQPDRAQAFKANTPNYTETTDFVGSINFNF